MNIVEERISGNCLEAIGIPNKGTAVIDQDEKPRVFDVVWCDSPTGSVHGYLKQIVQTGERSIVRTRYVDRERDYLFLSPSIYGVVLQVLDENRNVVWERPQMTTADRVRSMDDESLAILIVEAQVTMLELALQQFGIEFSFPEEGKESAVAAALKKLQQPWEVDE